MDQEDRQAKLNEIACQVKQCQRCPLYKTANKAVPGQGNSGAKIMFIGEAPGYNEDQQGVPFCGAAGNLLDKLLASIGLKREAVFIGNVIKHRPPQNRDPLPTEIKACQPYLDQQIEIIDPKVIVTLGRFAMNLFLPGEYISQIHGQTRYAVYLGKKYVIMPLYHPAAALRNSKVMEATQEDFQKLALFINGDSNRITDNAKKEVNQDEQLSLID